jgi:hypothetical protein
VVITFLIHTTRFPALALALFRDCSVDANRFQCNLDKILDFLYGAGAILAIILVVIAFIAFGIYRRNKKLRLTDHQDSKSSRP